MGTSFVEVRGHGFWVSDGILQVWLRLLALHIENPSHPSSPASRIRDQWLLASGAGFVDCVPADLDEAVSTVEGALLVRKAMASLRTALEQSSSGIPKEALNLLGMPVVFGADVSTRSLIDVADAFADLLDGRVTTRASDAPTIPGATVMAGGRRRAH